LDYQFTTVIVSQSWVVSFKMSLSSSFIATVALLIIVVVVAVVVVDRLDSTVLGRMANPLAVTALGLLLVAGPLFLQFLSDSIRPEGFLSSVLLWLVIIVAVIGVGVTIVVVESSSVVKLSFVIT
ncbi:hypothetical protein Tco_0182224, partial [Tanacetum coccineum]